MIGYVQSGADQVSRALDFDDGYNRRGKSEKKLILDEFTAATGYHRKYAILLFKAALVQVWNAANRICSKRLVPFIPELIAVMERHGHLNLALETKARLLSISPATVDRLLMKVRQNEHPYGMTTTKTGSLLKGQIPVRTFVR